MKILSEPILVSRCIPALLVVYILEVTNILILVIFFGYNTLYLVPILFLGLKGILFIQSNEDPLLPVFLNGSFYAVCLGLPFTLFLTLLNVFFLCNFGNCYEQLCSSATVIIINKLDLVSE